MGKKRNPTKGKLLNLREWLTVPGAARHLSNIFEEEVNESDLLRIALDGHLKLSVYFVNHAAARCGKIVPYEDVEWRESKQISFMESGKGIPDKIKGNPQKIREYIDQFPPTTVMKSLNLDGERYLNLDDNVTTIRDVWDLSMIGNERLDVEHQYQMLTGGPEVTLQGLDGAFVEGKDGVMCQLQESFEQNEFMRGSEAQLEKIKERIASNNLGEEQSKKLLDQHKKNREEYLKKRKKKNHADDYYPAGGLPRDSVLVVRTQALMELQERLSQEEPEKKKPLDIREERTYLNIIGALLEVITGESPGLQKHPDFISQAKLIEHFCDFEMPGLSKSTLESKFAAAKRSIIGDC